MLFVVGDSHALALAPLLEDFALTTGWHVSLYDNAGCPYLSLQPHRDSEPRCVRNVEAVSGHLIERLRPGDIVFLPSLRMPRFVDQWTRYDHDAIEAMALRARDDAERDGAVGRAVALVSRLTAQGAHVVLQAPNLLLRTPLYRCADPWTRGHPLCAGGPGWDRLEFQRLRKPMLNTVQSVAAAMPGVSVFDPFPLLCPVGPSCDGFRDGRPLFFDGDHVSGYANRLLAAPFRDAMLRVSGGS